MTVDIFNALNALRTNPAGTSYSFYANTTTVNAWVLAGPQAAFIWSNALSSAALEYVNEKGRDGSAKEASIFLTSRQKYAYTVCNYEEFELTHSLNTQGSWNVNTVMDGWLSTTGNKFTTLNFTTDPGHLTHVGIACSCDYSAGVRCAFIFA